MTLNELKIGQTAQILAVNGQGALRRHLLDMGLTPHTEVMVRKVAPMGDPIELHLRGYELTIRIEDAQNIDVDALTTQSPDLEGRRSAAVGKGKLQKHLSKMTTGFLSRCGQLSGHKAEAE